MPVINVTKLLQTRWNNELKHWEYFLPLDFFSEELRKEIRLALIEELKDINI